MHCVVTFSASIKSDFPQSARVLDDISFQEKAKMVRAPSVDQNGKKKGAWSKEEDDMLRAYVLKHGHQNWRQLPNLAGKYALF